MTTARDKIAEIISETLQEDSGHIFGIDEAADAILAALPDMIAPLVWDGFRSGPYKIYVYDQGADLWFCTKAFNCEAGYKRLLGAYVTRVSIDDLKKNANAHHRATIMAAFQTPAITP
jgi:hypothetical protein